MVAITQIGQACRHCSTGVVRAQHKPGWAPKKGQPFYFKWWFKCPNPNCKALYMVEEAKVWLVAKPQPNVDQQFKARLEREP